ncbi:hypothetical protein [Roseovarius gaetbuli]|uniref:hypothetical protein n=1 Tax=Roseovarius gaetbuli TaxID=1356575 RepID=UPI001BAEEF49|nr:hypothetical protein [Roseovarius gaetbuli]
MIRAKRRIKKVSKQPSAALTKDVCFAGQSRLMLMQRDRPPLDDKNSELVAAVRHVFPKAAVQNCQNGRNLNRTFAASVMDVSVADGVDGSCITRRRNAP